MTPARVPVSFELDCKRPPARYWMQHPEGPEYPPIECETRPDAIAAAAQMTASGFPRVSVYDRLTGGREDFARVYVNPETFVFDFERPPGAAPDRAIIDATPTGFCWEAPIDATECYCGIASTRDRAIQAAARAIARS